MLPCFVYVYLMYKFEIILIILKCFIVSDTYDKGIKYTTGFCLPKVVARVHRHLRLLS